VGEEQALIDLLIKISLFDFLAAMRHIICHVNGFILQDESSQRPKIKTDRGVVHSQKLKKLKKIKKIKKIEKIKKII
jgi:hypothetical protein